MYGRDNFIKAKQIVESRRTAAVALSESRAEELRRRDPKIAALDEELSKTGFLIFKTACAGKDISAIRERNAALMRMREDAIAALGLPRDYADVKYTCPECADTGYTETGICKCLRSIWISENIRSSGIGNNFEKQSFENFDINWYRPDAKEYENMKTNFERAKAYAKNFTPSGAKNLFFIGTTGLGKTHLSTAIAKSVIEKGYEVVYDTAQNIVDDFGRERFQNGERVSDKYNECDLLIIDDLGTELINNFTVSVLYNLLNTRANKNLPTIISTNLKEKELAAAYEGRIISRLFGSYEILHFVGRDHRIY